MASATKQKTDYACDLTEAQFQLAFPEQVGSRPTFGLVRDQNDWFAKRSDPQYQVPGIPLGIGNLRRFERKVFTSGKITLPNGQRMDHWGFRDENGVEDFPSTPVRIMGGDLVQATLKASKNRHTIHWHGIEPDMDNDGVGHTSFEVKGNYTYQWRAHPANAGTYFYHCHVNTVLHVQMGLFGALIIDPYEPEAHPLGRKPLHDAPDEWRYKPQYERIWPLYAADPSWHKLHHLAGFCGEDAGLHDFNPTAFSFGRHFQKGSAPIMGDARQPVAVSAPLGENILNRIIHATYFPVEIDFGELGQYVSVIEADGRGLRDGIDLDGLGAGRSLVALPWNEHTRRMSSAERLGLLIRPPVRGTWPVEIKYRHWITQEVVGVTRTQVTVS